MRNQAERTPRLSRRAFLYLAGLCGLSKAGISNAVTKEVPAAGKLGRLVRGD